MIVAGITGGIGMGKSTATAWLMSRGERVCDTDVLARNLVEPGKPALTEIIDLFSLDALDSNGQLNRRWLAERVFEDVSARIQLEQILHPRIHQGWKTWLAQAREEGAVRAFVVVPLLYEKRYEAEFDRVVCLGCSTGTQRRRLNERGWSDSQISQRNAAQLATDSKMARADFVVWTEGLLAVHEAQWPAVIARLRI